MYFTRCLLKLYLENYRKLTFNMENSTLSRPMCVRLEAIEDDELNDFM